MILALITSYISRFLENFNKIYETDVVKYHVTRLESLKTQVRQPIEILAAEKSKSAASLMSKTYEGGFYQTAFDVTGGKVGNDFVRLDQSKIDKVLRKPWTADNRTFSDRVWKDKTRLINEIQQQIEQDIVFGKSAGDIIDDIAKKFDVEKWQARRLVMTESAYFRTVAEKDSLIELGVEQYKLDVTLDSRTSAACVQVHDLDLIYDLADFAVGIIANAFEKSQIWHLEEF